MPAPTDFRALRPLPLVIAALLVAAPPSLEAQAAGRITVEQFTLPNGLSVILSPGHASQVVSVSIWYRAGSRAEPAGKAGLAKLFERLMFAGSSDLPGEAHPTLVDDAGGFLNADVDEEVARFGEVLPSNHLALGLWLEARRMHSLTINDSTVARARLATLDELSQRVTQQPYAAAILDGAASLYDSSTCPGYTHPTIGRLGSITGITTADAQAFFRDHYTPGSATLTIAGDFDPAAARRLVNEYFGGLPRGSDLAPSACSATFHSGARSRAMNDRQTGRIAVGQFYRVPAHDHADTPALELLGVLMSQGSGSRLATVAAATRAALSTQGGLLGDRRAPGAFGIFALAAPGVSADTLTALLAAQAAWAAGDSLTEAALARAKKIYLATAVSLRERPMDIADLLQHAALFHGTPEDVNLEPVRVLAVTLADIQRVARTWLTPDNALTLVVSPEGAS